MPQARQEAQAFIEKLRADNLGDTAMVKNPMYSLMLKEQLIKLIESRENLAKALEHAQPTEDG